LVVLIDVEDKECQKITKETKDKPSVFNQVFKGYCRKK
jgi:hypothetical protein